MGVFLHNFVLTFLVMATAFCCSCGLLLLFFGCLGNLDAKGFLILLWSLFPLLLHYGCSWLASVVHLSWQGLGTSCCGLGLGGGTSMVQLWTYMGYYWSAGLMIGNFLVLSFCWIWSRPYGAFGALKPVRG